MSSLNPDAPEWFPKCNDLCAKGYGAVANGIRASNNLRKRKHPDTNEARYNVTDICSKLSNRLLKISNKFLKAGNNSIQIKGCKDDENIDKITEANDNMLDIVNMEISTPNILPSTSKESMKITPQANQRIISSWNTRPVITTAELNNTTLLTARNIIRPQLSFKDKIDNSDTIFIPKIQYKPNALVPLQLTILYDENNEPIGYNHPYQHELTELHMPNDFFTLSTLDYPKSLEETFYKYIDTEEELDNLIDVLKNVTEIAVDLEHHSYRTYLGLTCLIQISTETQDFIIDALAIRHHIHKLNVIFTNPHIMKIFHGACNDILWLQRDFGVYVVMMFDTFFAAEALALPELSLKFLLRLYCAIEVDKKYQLADWRIRPLPAALIEYARMDTHYLLYIYRLMKRDINTKYSGDIGYLASVFDESRRLCSMVYHKYVIDDDSHLILFNKYRINLNVAQAQCFQKLYKWRDTVAREEDESPKYVLSNHNLVSLANHMPAEIEGIYGCCNNVVPPLLNRDIQTVHKIIQACRGIPVPPTLYSIPKQIATLLNAQVREPVPVDETHLPDFRSDYPTVLNNKLKFVCCNNDNTYTVSSHPVTSKYIIMELQSAKAKEFIPPFERYRKYRSLAQIEELKEFHEQEAKYKAAQLVKSN